MSLGRIEDYSKNLPIVEIYTAVQSEGSRAGYPTVVIRTTGCTHRCYFGEGGWCDSWYTSIHPEKGSSIYVAPRALARAARARRQPARSQHHSSDQS